MQYFLTTGWEDGVADLTERLIHELGSGNRVLWLVSGGSNIKASVEVMQHIAPELSTNLIVMPVDERYGPEGHKDSNWAALLKAGFSGEQAIMYPVLQGNLSFQAAIIRFEHITGKAFKAADIVIAQLGIGEDGHIAGILPKSEATKETNDLVIGYHTETYDRLTMSFTGLKKINAAYVFAFGEAKAQALKTLATRILPLETQPSQILKQLHEAYVYNDQEGD
jgi:6-phosphogluconolactonase/glucosamine-6-phosphate isomerase/deaminase